MPAYFGLVSDWCSKHPLTITFILFLLSVVISIYASEIKSFIRHWPKSTLRAARRNTALHQKYILELVHNDAYNLLLYLAWNLVHVVALAVLWLVFVNTISLILAHHVTSLSLWTVISGIAVGKALKVKSRLEQLEHYENSIQKLDKIIEAGGGRVDPKEDRIVNLMD